METSAMVITPLIGVGPVMFAMNREAVHSHLGEPDADEARRDFYYGGLLQVFFASDGRVESVQIARTCPLRPILYDIPVLELSAGEVVARIGRITPVRTDHREYPHTSLFADVEVSLWRPPDPDAPHEVPFEAVAASRAGLLSHML